MPSDSHDPRFDRPGVAALETKFEALSAHAGRPSVPPEYLLRATLLQFQYSVRSKRLLFD